MTTRTGRWPVLAWGLWDWGGSAFNAVVTTFVFTVYLTTDGLFGTSSGVSAALGWSLAAAGVVVAVIAPITGRRADLGGHRRLWLGIHSAVVVLCILLMFLVRPDPALLWLGLGLLAVGTVFFEFASVNYNAMLLQVSTRATIGRVSGFGWGMGYVGGIVLLLIVYFGFISPEVGLFGVTGDDGLDVRVSILVAGVWFAVFALPVLVAVPETPARASRAERVGVIASYRALFAQVAGLWRESRSTVAFLIASAVFRDGLTGVFTFGGVLAQGTFGFDAGEVILFAIAANVVAGVATISVGALDDRIGPKAVIVASLIGLVVCGTAVFVLHDGGSTVFWIFGLLLCLFVGPAQSASRSYLARLIPEGREGEIFGLYATTGRAASFLAPAAFAAAVSIAAAVSGSGEANVQYWGILGLVLVLAVGLVLLLPVRRPPATAPVVPEPRLAPPARRD
ncbi:MULTISPECIES: MFS transporter [unclassified Rathayibacter]|jgi:UMF1 family MFS transporter|uniref:MFS transporter n=1 Tax=unclassified Rathayibacter TaxID=2609250 RepID=UPI000CE833FA|nr:MULTISPECIES: MFS transporter [unclassified Rathayibacter]PPF12591.1 MFS transporter [Rathayibacter sp. AY1A5]PPF29325.1 MFS transporter [Rathayibacter sp. AY1F2]PPF49409.1 MFS transporter [Rathayibacter sp. AY1A1]PPG17468.1 MFS transporter [Rathayibacter sp. AY1C6]PPG84327.1 MFS transporter [Rathayibacter sp. AY1H2]